jgi:protein required for attachment to host cells
MPSETTWIVAADGASARFFVRPVAGAPLSELKELALTAEAERRHHGQATAVHDAANHGHLAPPHHHDRQDDDERHFLAHIAGRINLAVDEHSVGRLVICAPPRALGVLRDRMSAAARRLVTIEVAKDLVRENVRDIDARMKEHKV